MNKLMIFFFLFLVAAATPPNDCSQEALEVPSLKTQATRWELVPDKSGEMHWIDVQNQPQPFFSAFLDIKVFLYTKNETRRAIDFLNPLKETSFNTNDLTVFMIHGWQDDGERFPMVIESYLSKSSVNCILVDWSAGSKTIDYFSASNRIYEVAEFIVWFIDNEFQKNVLTSNVHIVGHSLGAHAAGCVGKNLQSFKIDKIFGLDPAGPLFENTKREKRLDKDDADQVIVVHTTIRLGILKPIGHLDFYMNYGHSQPGCGFDLMTICGHSQVMDYFAECINSDGFIGVFCSPIHYVDLVKRNECMFPLQQTLILKPSTTKRDDYSRILVVKTNDKFPFATFMKPFFDMIEKQESIFTRYKNNVFCWLKFYSGDQCENQSE